MRWLERPHVVQRAAWRVLMWTQELDHLALRRCHKVAESVRSGSSRHLGGQHHRRAQIRKAPTKNFVRYLLKHSAGNVANLDGTSTQAAQRKSVCGKAQLVVSLPRPWAAAFCAASRNVPMHAQMYAGTGGTHPAFGFYQLRLRKLGRHLA